MSECWTCDELRAERDALTEKLSLVTEDYIKHRNALEKAEAALRHWQTRESAMNCDACACLGLAIPDELRDTAPREEKP